MKKKCLSCHHLEDFAGHMLEKHVISLYFGNNTNSTVVVEEYPPILENCFFFLEKITSLMSHLFLVSLQPGQVDDQPNIT